MSEQEFAQSPHSKESLQQPQRQEVSGEVDNTSPQTDVDFDSLYITTLTEPQRSIEAQGLLAGDVVIRNVAFPSEIMPDSPANREEFRRRHYVWTNESRSLAWFPPKQSWSETFQHQADQCQARRQAFCATIGSNVESLRGKRMPSPRLPFFIRATGLTPSVSKVESLADLTAEITEEVYREAAPDNVTVNEEWLALTASLNSLTIYRLRTSLLERPTIDIVCSFVTPLTLDGKNEAKFARASSVWIDRIRALYDKWKAENGEPCFTCFSIGTPVGWHDQCEAVEDRTAFIALSQPNYADPDQSSEVLVEADLMKLASDPLRGDEPAWTTRLPAESVESGDVRALLDRMQPETRAQRIARIKRAVDQLLDDRSFEGTVHAQLLSEKTGYRRQLILDAMDQLQRSDDYKCLLWQHSNPKRVIIVRETDPRYTDVKPLQKVYSDQRWKRVLSSHFLTLSSAVASVGGLQLVVFNITGSWSLSALLAGIPLWFAARCAQIAMVRKACEV